MVNAFNPSIQEAKAGGSEFKASLVSKANPRITKTVTQTLSWKKTQKTKNQKCCLSDVIRYRYVYFFFCMLCLAYMPVHHMHAVLREPEKALDLLTLELQRLRAWESNLGEREASVVNH